VQGVRLQHEAPRPNCARELDDEETSYESDDGAKPPSLVGLARRKTARSIPFSVLVLVLVLVRGLVLVLVRVRGRGRHPERRLHRST
jgi:hypothetical protein